MRNSSFCAEENKEEALKCEYCGFMLEDALASLEPRDTLDRAAMLPADELYTQNVLAGRHRASDFVLRRGLPPTPFSPSRRPRKYSLLVA